MNRNSFLRHNHVLFCSIIQVYLMLLLLYEVALQSKQRPIFSVQERYFNRRPI